jgi:hypothetical protein
MNCNLFVKVAFFLGFLLALTCVSAQVPDTTIIDDAIQDRLEVFTEFSETDVDFTEFIELLEQLQKNPINLNRTDVIQLRMLPFLSEIQISNLLGHIVKYGQLATIYELQSIDGFDMETIQQILPYVTVTADLYRRKTSMKDILENGKHQFFVRHTRILQEQKGYTDISEEDYQSSPNSRYLGSPDRIYTRYRFTYYNSLSIGITAEKDAGEEFFQGSMKQGFDFYSAHIWMRDIGIFKSLAIGDYNLSFGQGTGLWTNLGFGKSFDIATMKRTGRGITPYTSVDENAYLRGIAASYEIGKFEIYGFYSNKNIGGGMLIVPSDTLDSEELYITSLNSSGLHRTANELARRKSINEVMYGSRAEFKTFRLTTGTMLYHTAYEYPLNRALKPYNQYEFNAQNLTVASLDYSYVYNNMNIFGEASRSDNGGMAFVQGIYYSLSKDVTLAFHYRNFQKEYQSLYSSAFSESSKVSNEQGFFTGIDVRLHPKWTFNGYADLFRFPWLKYRIDAPSRGDDMLAQLSHRFSRNAQFSFRYRRKIRFMNTSADEVIRSIGMTEKSNYRIHGRYAISPSFTLGSRIEVVEYLKDNEIQTGFLLYQDITYNPENTPWRITCRYALFDTQSYDDRLYAYEHDVLYAYSIPAFYYKGSRAYVLLKYTVSRNIDLWIRYAQTFYSNRQTIGSGLDEIQGKLKSELKTQIRIRF